MNRAAELLDRRAALELVLAEARPLPAVREPLAAALCGRVLAEDVAAAHDLPPLAVSAMDGYAARAGELGGPPLPVAFRVAAGDPPGVLPPGAAAAIATGAPVPDGADCVVRLEDAVERDGGVSAPSPDAGANVRPAGGDVCRGGRVAGRGSGVTPALLGALASAGVAEVAVAPRPRLAVLVTGSELVPVGRPLAPGQIHDSNGVTLAAAAGRAGADVTATDVVADEAEATRAALADAVGRAQVVVSSGGVSVGPHDHVKPALAALGVREVLWRIALKPGKPLWFGVGADGTLVFGLPGNPVSALVCFELFVRPAVLALQGAPPPVPLRAPLAAPVRRLRARDHAVRCTLERTATGTALRPLPGQESHLIVQSAGADAIALVDRGEGEVPAGTPLDYLAL